MFNRFRKQFFLYAGLPEMRLFWIFLPFLAALTAINFFYLPAVLPFFAAGILAVLTAIIAVSGFRLAKLNLEIKIERNELKSIIANLRDGVIVYDPDFKILIFNEAAEQIFNLKSRDVVGQRFTPERAREDQFKLLVQVIFPSLAPSISRQSEAGVYPQVADISFEQPKLDFRTTTDKITDSQGRLLGFVKLVRDRTREIALLRSKTEFITVAAHQLRTPLSGVNWALENLMSEPLNESQKEIVVGALAAMNKILKTVDDLLDVSKIEEGKFGYQFENVNIVDFIEKIVAETGNLAKQFGVNLYFEKPAEQSIAVSVDPAKLSMVFFNLLDNAIRYNVENGEVAVKIERLQDRPYIKISVKDTGVGISPELTPKLFTKFVRGENVMKFATEGSGLGLYIVRNIIKRHGGEIWAETELNRGTTFHFTLPTDSKLIPSKEVVHGEDA